MAAAVLLLALSLGSGAHAQSPAPNPPSPPLALPPTEVPLASQPDAPRRAREAAAAAAAIPWGAPVVSIGVVPDDAVPRAAIEHALGANLSRTLLRELVRSAASQGRFAQVEVHVEHVAGGARIVVSAYPRRIVVRVEVRDAGVLPQDEVVRLFGIVAGQEVDEEAVERGRAAVLDAFVRAGYERAHVEIEERPLAEEILRAIVIRVDEGPPTRIARVVDDTSAASRDVDLVALLGMPAGAILDVEALARNERALERALHERYHLEAAIEESSIERTPSGAIVHVKGRVGPRYTVTLRGIEPLRVDDVRPALRLGAERFSGAASERALLARVVDVYRRAGFLEANATLARTPLSDRELVMRVDVVPGPRVHIDRIELPTGTSIPSSTLREQIVSALEDALREDTILFPVDSATIDAIGFGGATRETERRGPAPLETDVEAIYYEPAYRDALAHIENLYRARGYLSARVGPAGLVRTSATHAFVRVPIEQGPRTLIDSVVIDGNDSIDSARIANALALRVGDPSSVLAIEEGRIRVLELYRERGHLYADVQVDPTYLDEQRTRARLLVHVEESVRVHVGEIIVHGSRRVREGLIRDRLQLRSGDLLRPSALTRAQERLGELGVFSSVSITPRDPDQPERIKAIVVTVTERNEQYVDFTAGFSSGQGLRGSLEYGHRNLFGEAVSLTLRLQLAYQFIFLDPVVQQRYEVLTALDRLERRVALNVTLPHVDVLPNTRLSLDLAHFRDNERDFGYEKNSIVFSATWRPVSRFTLTVSPLFEGNATAIFTGQNLNDFLMMGVDPRLQRLLRVPEGESSLIATRVTASLDFRDSPFTPTEGVFASVVTEYVRTLSTQAPARMGAPDNFLSDFLKVSATLSGYVKLGRDVVIALQLRAGRVFHLNDASQTYPDRLFFLGGVDTVRGYLQDALTPQDIADEIVAGRTPLGPNGLLRGGDAFLLVRGEVRFPIFGSLHGGIFADLGNTWVDPAHLDAFRLRPSAGLGLRLATPVGPIAFDYGFLLERRLALNEPFGAFHFSIGVF